MLDVHVTGLSGPVPAEWARMTALKNPNVSDCPRIRGPLPVECAQAWTGLEYLFVFESGISEDDKAVRMLKERGCDIYSL